MLKSDSGTKDTLKNITAELFSLSPSALVTFYIIDVTDIGINTGTISSNEGDKTKSSIFRFHNNINLTSKSLFWQGNEYMAAPINAEGFETSVRGSPPTPKLSMTVSEDGVPFMSILKERILDLGDIIGAKFTRIRTFSRFLDSINFVNSVPPKNFFPDPNAELSRDIFYIDRKSAENKTFLEYELSSLFELEGIKLPGRVVSVNTCQWQYRSEGCLYECNSRRNPDIHGDGILPDTAPPVATNFDEPINTLIKGVPFTDKGEYNRDEIYKKGDFVYLNQRGLNYYFVSKVEGNTVQPPDSAYWISDSCSKSVFGCKQRFGVGNGTLPFGGFVSCNRFR